MTIINVNEQLLCPACEGEYLHHECVTVYDRREDAEQTRVTRVSGGTIASELQSSNAASNPSSRRDGLAIRFWCEFCSQISELTLEQHKGNTYLKWRKVGERRDELAQDPLVLAVIGKPRAKPF